MRKFPRYGHLSSTKGEESFDIYFMIYLRSLKSRPLRPTQVCLSIYFKKTILKLKISDSIFPDSNFDGLVHTKFYCGLMDGEIGLLILVGP